MKTNTILRAAAIVATLSVGYYSCVWNDKTLAVDNTVTPQELPSVVSGFQFPEDSATIYDWVNHYDTNSITQHAWGIWAGLTSNSDQVYNDDTLLIYETWLGISDIAAQCANGDKNGGCINTKSTREKLDFPHQLTHTFGTAAASPIDENPGFYVSVSYDPNAACHTTKNLLLNQSTLSKQLVKGKIGRIAPFPSNSVTIKPTYYIGKVSDEYIKIPAWQGTPDSLGQVFSPSKWNSYLYIDVKNRQTPGKIGIPVDSTQTDNPPKSAIINLNEFIHYSFDKDAADYINNQQLAGAGDTIVVGDLAILVCMHVGTKEISNWTWQTFYWAANPSKPDFPSSSWEAQLKPKELTGAASHYAVSTTYTMVWPNQPISGGTNTDVKPVIGYNPYLEAGLSAPFGNQNQLNPKFQYGMQTNCMSCHAMATVNNKKNASLKYTADQYVDMNDTLFIDWVQLDFAWSIQGNVNADY